MSDFCSFGVKAPCIKKTLLSWTLLVTSVELADYVTALPINSWIRRWSGLRKLEVSGCPAGFYIADGHYARDLESEQCVILCFLSSTVFFTVFPKCSEFCNIHIIIRRTCLYNLESLIHLRWSLHRICIGMRRDDLSFFVACSETGDYWFVFSLINTLI